MIRALLLVVAVAGCSDKKSEPPAAAAKPEPVAKAQSPAEQRASCEAARDKYVAWRKAKMDSVADKVDQATRDEMPGILDAAKSDFVEACVTSGVDMDASCFDSIEPIADPDKKQRCGALAGALAGTLAAAKHAAATEVNDPACEALRDKYIAWSTERAKSALAGGVAGAHTAELQAEADKELAIAKTKFVGACVAMGSSLDGSCFEIERGMSRDREKHRRCTKVVHELEAKLFAH